MYILNDMKRLRLPLAAFTVVLIGALAIVGVVLSEGSYAPLGTSNSLDGSNDALTWDQGNLLTIDAHGKYISLVQTRTGPTTNFTWSNDNGATWVQGTESYSFLTRGSIAYDPLNDKLHVIWAATSASDGIIYRRYGITRDGSNNITAISREDAAGINLQLDTSGSCSLEYPSAIWHDDGTANGALIAIWSKDSCAGLAQVRGSMRKLSLSAADGQAANWAALDGVADTFATEAPFVPADMIHGDTQGSVNNSIKIRGGTGARKDDLYVFVQESVSSGTDEVLAYRAIWNSLNDDFSGGWQSPVIVGVANTLSGYNLKHQLLSKVVLDETNDRLYISFARWITGGDGDTVSFAYLDDTDTPSATYDVYSALGTHSYAPTMSVSFDAILGTFVVAYVESTTNGDNGSIDYVTFDGSTLSTPVRFYTSPGGTAGENGSADIPVMYPSRVDNTLLFMFRVNGALPPSALEPHTVYFGTQTVPTPTPTPSPTPTSTPTPTPSPTPAPTSGSDQSEDSDNTAPASCTALPPGSAPQLYRIDRKGSEATLWIVPGSNPYTGIIIWYGEGESTNTHADPFDLANASGMIVRTIFHLQPNQSYSFRVQSKNDCSYSGSDTPLSIRGGDGTTFRGGRLLQTIRQLSNRAQVDPGVETSIPPLQQTPPANTTQMRQTETVTQPAESQAPLPSPASTPMPAPQTPLPQPTAAPAEPAPQGWWDWLRGLFR